MFEVTPEDIAQLDDEQLRTLVALLCEAELRQRGYSTAGVTWGGDQTAKDGGLDVRVSLPPDKSIEGYIPRQSTGFQVKKPDMPPSQVTKEMCPEGTLRPAIADLARDQGAYIIVSSSGSTSDSALTNRRNGMVNAVGALANQLVLDFYDRRRLASWVNSHSGLIVWTRRAVGRAIPGWEPYGPWAYPAGGAEAEYLLEGGVRIRPRPTKSDDVLPAADGIKVLRSILRESGRVVRLVGLSGVGKTRLAQALFDTRIGGDEALDQALAVYTNMNNDPDPQPISLASDLVANDKRAILIVDNCAPDLHSRLAALAAQTKLSVLTVEYDIREDQPEGTNVFEVPARCWAMASRRPRPSNSTVRTGGGAGRGRGFVMVRYALPRFVRAKRLASGAIGFYWELTGHYRRLGCTIPGEPLGDDYMTACGTDGAGGRAAALNALFDEWRAVQAGEPVAGLIRFGTVDWLFREYKQTKAYLEKVSKRSRRDYERTMLLVADIVTKKGDRIGNRSIKAITPVSADKIYDRVIVGPRGLRPRQGEKVVGLCARAWSVVHRLYPEVFNRDIPNPWRGVTKNRRTKAIKPAATRDQVYAFADVAVSAGFPEAGAAAVICFEWLQRPENVLAGYIRWTDYRGREAPKAIRIFHHKTGAIVLHPLEDDDGTPFYTYAESVLAKLPRRGIPMILHETRVKAPEGGKPKPTKLYSASGMAKLVRRIRGEDRTPIDFYFGCLPTRRDDRIGGGRTNRRPRSRTLGAQE
jgi:hypothetical protein